MAEEDIATTAAKVADAVTGPNTPANVTVKRPSRPAVWAVFAALVLITLGIAAVILVLSYGPWWRDSDAVALARINGLSWIGWLLCADVVLLVFAIVSPWVGRVEASAGDRAHLTLTGREP